MQKSKFIIGIDEVGRGALAGPVVVAAMALPLKSKIKNQISKIPLRDSKKLTPRQREIWFKYIKKNSKIFYAVVSVSPKIIDKINISQAANLAATKALKKLITNNKLPITKLRIFLDGGLYINSKIKNQNAKLQFKNQKFYIRTIIKGDEKISAIALASIVAKVTRDRLMIRLHKKFPVYNFQKHKGYGTKEHLRALKKHGPSIFHRRSFRPVNKML